MIIEHSSKVNLSIGQLLVGPCNFHFAANLKSLPISAFDITKTRIVQNSYHLLVMRLESTSYSCYLFGRVLHPPVTQLDMMGVFL